MQSKNLQQSKRLIKVTVRYFTLPYNRWQYYYSNGDGNMQMEHTDIEKKNFPQPYVPLEHTKVKPTYPDYYFPDHINDVRFNLKYDNFPFTYVRPKTSQKIYNNNDYFQMMHSIEWNEMQLDAQIEEPIQSNHYQQGSSQMKGLYFIIYFVIFGIIYTFYGHGILDYHETNHPFRKRYFPAYSGLLFLKTSQKENNFKRKMMT